MLSVVRQSLRRLGVTVGAPMQAIADATRERARGRSDTHLQARRLAAILDVNKRLALGPNLDEILARITREAAELVGVDAAGLRLLEGDTLVRVASFGPRHGMMISERLPVGKHLAGLAVSENRPIISRDLATDPRCDPDYQANARATGLRSSVGLPLRGRNRPLGVLAVIGRGTGRFSGADVHLLEAFADQAAIAVENARLLHQEQEARRQLEAIRTISEELTRELDLTKLLELIVRRAVGLFETESGIVALWDEDGGALVPRASCGLSGWVPPRLKLGEGMMGTAARRRQGLVVNDYQASSVRTPTGAELGVVRAGLNVPILHQDRLIGVIGLAHHTEGRTFSERDQRLLETFANQAASAIENARLFEQAATVEALRELARLKSEFLSTASHELRTPLSVIFGFSELLQHRASRLSGVQIAAMAAEIHLGSRTMVRLVDDLLDYSRLEQGRLRLAPRRVCVAAVLRHLIETYRPRPGGHRLEADLPEGLEAVMDPDQLAQMAGKLLTNALRYAPEGPIILRARTSDGLVRVEVSDRGPGIPPAEQPRIWETFYRGTEASTSHDRGGGLGLAVVKDLAELQGGQVGMQSTPGLGATFWFTLPLEPPTRPDDGALAETPPPPDATPNRPASARSAPLTESRG